MEILYSNCNSNGILLKRNHNDDGNTLLLSVIVTEILAITGNTLRLWPKVKANTMTLP